MKNCYKLQKEYINYKYVNLYVKFHYPCSVVLYNNFVIEVHSIFRSDFLSCFFDTTLFKSHRFRVVKQVWLLESMFSHLKANICQCICTDQSYETMTYDTYHKLLYWNSISSTSHNKMLQQNIYTQALTELGSVWSEWKWNWSPPRLTLGLCIY